MEDPGNMPRPDEALAGDIKLVMREAQEELDTVNELMDRSGRTLWHAQLLVKRRIYEIQRRHISLLAVLQKKACPPAMAVVRAISPCAAITCDGCPVDDLPSTPTLSR